MGSQCCSGDDIKKKVVKKYGAIAEDKMKGCSCGCSGDDVYSVFSEDYGVVEGYAPEADLSLGCGIPTETASIKTGDIVIDLGSGAGNDCFVARNLVGEGGQVIGIDMTPEMIDRARKNAESLGFNNVKFRQGEIENLPVTANKADVVISNCVINLVPDKHMAFHEIIRVLKPGGHFAISDVVIDGKMPESLVEVAELYAGCVSGAININEYLKIVEDAGFQNIAVTKRKRIELPDELICNYLSDKQFIEYKQSVFGIFSITLYAEKPTCNCQGK